MEPCGDLYTSSLNLELPLTFLWCASSSRNYRFPRFPLASADLLATIASKPQGGDAKVNQKSYVIWCRAADCHKREVSGSLSGAVSVVIE